MASAAATDTIGSLVIDLRANVAQLQADMDQVKDIVQKSSAQMSSQMKADMQETRGVLALLRDDFGIVIPREIQKSIASSKELRESVLAVGAAVEVIAGLEIFKEAAEKIYEYVQKTAEQTAEEAKKTQEVAVAAQESVDATLKRKETLDEIGKGEEEQAAIRRAYFEEEKKQNTVRLADLQSQLTARLLLLKSYDNMPDATADRAASAEAGIDENGSASDESKASSQSFYAEFVQQNKAQLEALQKNVDDAKVGIKLAELDAYDFSNDLSKQEVKNDEAIALARVALRRQTAEDGLQADKISLDAYIQALKATTEQEYDIKLQGLYDTLGILEKDPTRNVKAISDVLTQVQVVSLQKQQAITNDLATEVEKRKQLTQEAAKAEAEAFKNLTLGEKNTVLPSDLISSMPNGGAPKLDGSISAFMQAQSDRFNGSTMKDAAAQGKQLTEAMEALLTPTQKFQIVQAEIIPLMDKYKDYPDVVKALTSELERANPEFQKLQQASAEFGKDLAGEIENIAISGKSLHDALLTILQDLEKIVLEATLLKPLENLFNGGSSGTGGFLGVLGHLFGFGGGGGGAAAGAVTSGPLPGDFLMFADGGDPPVGVPSMVGEDGPELFVPHSSGTVVPNHMLGGGSTTYINIDARGAAPGMEANMLRGLKKALAENQRRSVAGAIDYQRRR